VAWRRRIDYPRLRSVERDFCMPDALRPNAAAVATHHPLAAGAACAILRSGGNAVDAAVAAMATLCVVLPGSVGFGGYGGSMVLYSAAKKRCFAIDFDSRAPLAYRDNLFADDFSNKSNYGYLAVTVPAVIAGLAMALREFGTKTWDEVTARAIELAESGFLVDEESHRQLVKWHAGADPLSRRAHFRDDNIPAVGQTWVQKDLAALLRKLAADGPESFYRGEVAQKICRQVREHGGILAEADFESYQARLVEPLNVNYRGCELFTPPPPSGGITTLQILKTLELFDLAALDHWGSAYLHLVAEASKMCFAERHGVLGDPDFVKMPMDEMLSAERAAERAANIRRHDIRAGVESLIDSNPHTSNVSIVDTGGNVCSLTATQGFQFGSRVVIDGLGLVMGHGMSRFDFSPAHPDHPNRPQPGKRMHHNMSPTIALRGAGAGGGAGADAGGRPFAAVGLPGGTKIITVTAQLLINLIDFRCSAQQTVLAPRIHAERGNDVAVSGSLAPGIVRELEAMGHSVTRGQSIGGPPNEVAGPANAVVIDAKGHVTAASSAAPDAACVLH
jgi:gamma-glutamyltranspeptidase/glutathione hydrolase